MNRVMPDADWVFDDKNRFQKLKGGRSYRVGVMISDLHGKHSHGVKTPVGFRDLINTCGYDAVFSKYDEIHGTGLNPRLFKDRVDYDYHFLPWSVDVDRFTPTEKFIDVTFIGATHQKTYPLRYAMFNGLYYAARGYKIVRDTSPRGKTFERTYESHPDKYVGDKYSELLNSTRIMLFGSSIYRYPVQKYFESLSSGCVILSDQPSSAKKLGLINRKTYIDVNIGEWEYELQSLLEDEKTCKKISKKSRELALHHHCHEVRALEFLEMLDK